MRVAVAIILGLALLAGQIFHGGALIPFLALPAYAILVLAGLLALLANRESLSPGVAGVGILLVGYALVRCVYGPDAELARIQFGELAAYALVFFAVAVGVTGRVARLWLVGAVLLVAAVQMGFGVFQMTVADESPLPFWLSEEMRMMYFGRFSNRARGLFFNPNQFAWVMNVAALLALGIGVWGRIRPVWRIILLYFAAVFAGMSVLSASRGGLISLGAGVAVFLGLSLLALLVSVRRGRGWLIVGGLAGAAVVMVAVYFVFASNWVAQGRVDTLLNAGVRSALTENAIRLFQSAPMFGVGPGMFLYAARWFRVGGMSNDAIFVHNDWLQFLAEFGFVGFALLIVFLGIVLVQGTRAFLRLTRDAVAAHDRPASVRGALAIASLSALAACMAHSVTDFNLHIPGNGILFAIILGMAASPMVDAVRVSSAGRWMVKGPILIVLAILSVLMGGYVWKYSAGDYFSLRAENALRAGDVPGALEWVAPGVLAAPNSPRILFASGRAHYDYEASLQFLNDAEETDLIIDDESIDDEEAAGEDEPIVELSEDERRRLFLESADAFSKAGALRPLERSFLVGESGARWEIDEREKALILARMAIARDPLHGYTWGNYADLLLEADLRWEALRILEVGAVLDGGSANAAQAEDLREELGLAPIDEEGE